MRSVSESETATLSEALNELKILKNKNYVPFIENDDNSTNR